MVALLSAYVLLPGQIGSQRLDPYPDAVLDALSRSGVDVEGTRSAWAGQLSYSNLTVGYSIEARGGRAIAIDLTSRYSFPVRVSSRGLQDWAIGTRTGVVAQSYLDGSVYLAERLPLQNPVTGESLFTTVRDGFNAFGLFQSSYLRPLNGQQVFDQPTIAPPKPSDKMVVDYLSALDVSYLAKLWGWTYEGPFGAPISTNWTVPVKVDGKLWRISGPTINTPGAGGLSVTGQFQARTPKAQDRVRRWSRKFKSDQVLQSPDSAEVTVSTNIDMKGGMSLANLRKRILEFIRRAEKLPSADDSVFG